MYLVFTRMPGESYRKQLGSLLLCLSDVFPLLINSLVGWFCTSALGWPRSVSERGVAIYNSSPCLMVDLPLWFSVPSSHELDFLTVSRCQQTGAYMSKLPAVLRLCARIDRRCYKFHWLFLPRATVKLLAAVLFLPLCTLGLLAWVHI